MSETLGTIVDKLTIVNIKIALWEERRRNQSITNEKRLEASDVCTFLNAERNSLITEFDEQIGLLLRDPTKHHVHNKFANYGGGSSI